MEAIRLFFWTHPWWHAAAVLVPPVLVAAFFAWRENRHSAEANRLRQEAIRLRKESKDAVEKIGGLQDERNQLERERNSLMEKIADNTKRPLTQAEKTALRLRKYLRKTAHISEGTGYWGGIGAEIVEVNEDNIVTLFCPATHGSPSAFAVCVHCDDLQILEEPLGSCALQVTVLKRYGKTLQLGEIRNWDDRKTLPIKPLPRGETVFHATYVQPGSSNDRRVLIYAPTEGNPMYTLATLVDGKESLVVSGDKVEISKKFVVIQVEYRAEGFRYNGGTGAGGSHGLFVCTT